MELIAAFALSTSATSSSRLSKPFNPLLHETYELSNPELGFEFVAEQVSHHPPVSAFYSRGEEFEFYGNVEFKIKFWGRSLEVTPQSSFTLHLKAFNEKYTWQGIPCYVHNLYMGKMYMCWNGTINIKCLATDLQTEIKFAGPVKNGPDTMLYGEILQGKNRIRVLYGNWTEYIASTSLSVYFDMKHQWKKEYRSVEKSGNTELITMFPDSSMIWRVHSKPPGNKDYYNMTYFALMLNEKLSDPSKLPPTDARFRPDIRFMEEGDMDAASNEKERLEEKQRAKGKPRPPAQWFSLDKTGSFVFNGNYWKRDFSNCEDIY
uniref:Oxysterol-binding protein n=1 Tax=Panagrolaimus superbus TaxID=310955 RepID=A0A914Y495_9BILA